MGVRGRTSGAALAIPRKDNIIAGPGRADRIPPNLGEREAQEWRMIMDSPSAEMFPIETHANLAEYCCLVADRERLEAMMNGLTADDLATIEGRREYVTLMNLRQSTGVRQAALAAKLRLTPSSRTHKDKAGTIGRKPRGTKPWER